MGTCAYFRRSFARILSAMGVGFHYFPQITTFFAIVGFSLLVAGADFLRRRSAFRALASGGPDEMDPSSGSDQPVASNLPDEARQAELHHRSLADEPTLQLFQQPDNRAFADEPTVRLFLSREPAPVEQPVELTENPALAAEPTVQLFLSPDPARVEQPAELPEPHCSGAGWRLAMGDFVPLSMPAPIQQPAELKENPALAAEPTVQLFLSREPAPVAQATRLPEPHRGGVGLLAMGDFMPLSMPAAKQRSWSPSERHGA
jgi:hypothetical protein